MTKERSPLYVKSTKKKKIQTHRTESRLLIAKGKSGVGEMCEAGLSVQTSSDK